MSCVEGMELRRLPRYTFGLLKFLVVGHVRDLMVDDPHPICTALELLLNAVLAAQRYDRQRRHCRKPCHVGQMRLTPLGLDRGGRACWTDRSALGILALPQCTHHMSCAGLASWGGSLTLSNGREGLAPIRQCQTSAPRPPPAALGDHEHSQQENAIPSLTLSPPFA